MTWFKVDDGFWSHPKTMMLSAEAVALWIRAGSYSCQHLTDGHIPAHALRLLGASDAAAELVASGLWKETAKGWKFHDWDEYQETSREVKQRRDQAKERMRKVREQRRGSREQPANVRENFERSSPNPDPTRPDHSLTESEGARKRAYALPDDWKPTDAHRTLAAEKRADCDAEAEKLRDWAASKGETRKDWDATFRNWLRNARPSTTPPPLVALPGGRRLQDWELRG